MQKPNVAIALLAVCLTACTSLEIIPPTLEEIDRPPVGTEASVRPGEPLLVHARVYSHATLDLMTPLRKPAGLLAGYEIPAQSMKAAYRQDGVTYFTAEDMLRTDLLYGARSVIGGLCQRDGDPALSVWMTPGQCIGRLDPQPDWHISEAYSPRRPSLIMELIYAGRTGDTVRLLYREYSNALLRDGYTQDISYDLSETSVLAFLDAEIEVLEATNAKLRYRVISGLEPASGLAGD